MRYIENKRTVYDELAAIYPARFDRLSDSQIQVRTTFVDRMKARTTNPSLLDVGCGTGRDLRFFREFGCTVTGIDLSPNMLAEARSKGLSNLINDDFLAHPFGDAAFDGIWCLSMLQDLADPAAVEAAVCKLVDLLSPGGLLFIVHPRFPGHAAANITIERREYGFAESHVNLSAEQLEAMFAHAGLATVFERRTAAAVAPTEEAKEYVEFILERRQ